MRRILLVEDEPMLRDTFELIISSQPYLIDVAENGMVALDFCKHNTYDLILLDLMMPVLDGIGFLREFRESKPESTRVVVLSNLSSGKEFELAMRLGAERSVLKSSLSPKELLSMIRYELDAT